MPELVEQMYCSQQIVIPPKYPYILKRYCKAAIKTQPYDLLRWSFEYFKALSHRRPPPVKLRLEYPIYSTEGGLTRGCLKVLAQQLTLPVGSLTAGHLQLSTMTDLPLPVARAAWQGFCLDPLEFCRILCLCEVYLRSEEVPFLHFIAVAAGLLTKNLTHTMILLCETLTKEPDGGSAAIPVENFLVMYRFLAKIDASSDVKYIDGYREGHAPPSDSTVEEEEVPESTIATEDFDVDFWGDQRPDLQKLPLINDHVARAPQISEKLNMPVLGKIERSPSMERAAKFERETYLRERKDKPMGSDDVDAKLRELSAQKFGSAEAVKDAGKVKDEPKEEDSTRLEIHLYNESNVLIPFEIYGEPEEIEEEMGEEQDINDREPTVEDLAISEINQDINDDECERIKIYVETLMQEREVRREDLEQTFEEIAQIVDRFKSAHYDLGMVAGRQMSTTSGEFIVAQLEKEIMDYIDEQIGILPDPDLKKKKAKPDEVLMIRDLLNTWLTENMAIIIPEVEEEQEEEEEIPDIMQVYAVPGIGPTVDDDIVRDFEYYALESCKVQAELFMPRNIRHFMCPPLEKYEEYKYDDIKCKEEDDVAVGGAITD